MIRPELGKPKTGDPVHVRQGRETTAASITAVGRVWVTIEALHGRGKWRMRIDKQNEGYPSAYQGHFYTPAQFEYDERMAEARTFLLAQGVDVRPESPWAGDDQLLALVELLRANAPTVTAADR